MDKEYLKQVKAYLLQTGRLRSSFDVYSKIYSVTTENIYGFLKNYDLKGKNVLSVAGSGDQRLNAYLLGARNVTVFDSNPLTLVNMNLKDAAIKTLSFRDFNGLYGIEDSRFLNEYSQLDNRLLERLEGKVDEDTFDFFKFIVDNEDMIDVDNIFFNIINDIDILKKCNYYLNPKKYVELRKKIVNKNIDFINCDITELPYYLGNKKFDMILLSNISDYTHFMYENNDLAQFNILINSLINNLNPYGIIQVGYIYSKHGKKDCISDFHIDSKRKQFFPTNEFHTVLVDSFDEPGKKDKVITYQKIG